MIRVDNGPAFESLAKNKNPNLEKLNITVELVDKLNKNGVASVDKAIQELESQFRKFCPEGSPLSPTTLAQSVMLVNELIRKQNLSASEIQFSRDMVTGQNLPLQDDTVADRQRQLREENHKYSQKSKVPNGIEPVPEQVNKGDLVYVKNDGDKHNSRQLYMVTNKGVADTAVYIQKLLHAHSDEQTKLSTERLLVDTRSIYKANVQNVVHV